METNSEDRNDLNDRIVRHLDVLGLVDIAVSTVFYSCAGCFDIVLTLLWLWLLLWSFNLTFLHWLLLLMMILFLLLLLVVCLYACIDVCLSA